MKQMNLLDKNKSNSGNIPTGMLKAMREIVFPYLTDCVNSAVYDCNFQNELKEADLTPLFKNDDSNYKGNFRPIKVLPAASKSMKDFKKTKHAHTFKTNSPKSCVVSGGV